MKRICTLLLAAGMLLGVATGASAIDFKAKGQWLVGFAGGENQLLSKTRTGANGSKQKYDSSDKFAAQQRVRLQLDAVASEALSGTVFFEIGNQTWGKAEQGGALGADGTMVKVKRAYIDWLVPQTDLKFRMGIQGVTLPNVAGGSAIMDTDAAAITASYQFNENVALTALWARPLNDNYIGNNSHGSENYHQNYLDNMDLFALMLPVKLDGFEITPWAMYGVAGKNSLNGYNADNGWGTADGNLDYSLRPYPGISGRDEIGGTSKAYGNMFWAGLPFAITAWDPLNIEVDINYGYVESMGRFDASKNGVAKRGSTERQGWLAKALVEYKLDWGVPGIFGWYGSGDDGNVKNGSERMPSIVPMGNFTSFMGDGNYGWMWVDNSLEYAGTWGIGLQIRDMSFMEDLKHTFRVAYWGGTNSPSMVKYMDSAYAWNDGWGTGASPYLTTNDGLLELNLVNSYQMYENFDVNLELGYIANFMDNDTWKKSNNPSSFQKQDAWKAQLIFAYSF
ncbi:outer membrane homotrimeric porin [uncultured Desulfovibrio sp.]|uniref:outer membrane homotrimeric porin n=1 Tax=uncultured Desulfovibrio sp. TaxID=167968 RepID=UPI002612D13D|nr:outer membrane homotrimeric porin [uncultured Desulfovibrio sp.]